MVKCEGTTHTYSRNANIAAACGSQDERAHTQQHTTRTSRVGNKNMHNTAFGGRHRPTSALGDVRLESRGERAHSEREVRFGEAHKKIIAAAAGRRSRDSAFFVSVQKSWQKGTAKPALFSQELDSHTQTRTHTRQHDILNRRGSQRTGQPQLGRKGGGTPPP
jgi:hypothetical protein